MPVKLRVQDQKPTKSAIIHIKAVLCQQFMDVALPVYLLKGILLIEYWPILMIICNLLFLSTMPHTFSFNGF